MKQPIFIHSLFRTGSTYLWNAFRQQEDTYCYYEPFNQFLSRIDVDRPYVWGDSQAATGKVRHPRLARNQLYEYKKLLRPGKQGVPYFKKSFSFDDYCNNEPDPDRKKYIDHLLHGAAEEGKTPVLQFNRSALRAKWFKANYPASLHIYLARSPRDQWQSYVSLAEEQGLDIFLIMDLMIAGKSKSAPYFKNLAPYVYLASFDSPGFPQEEQAYRSLLGTYSYEELYFIFYFIWFTALWENVIHSDILLSIDLLNSDAAYTRQVLDILAGHGIAGVDLSGAAARHYSGYKLDPEKTAHIEASVRAIISRDRDSRERDHFLSKLSPAEKELFDLGEESLTSRNDAILEPLSKDAVIKKQEAVIGQLLQSNIKLDEKNNELELAEQALRRTRNSYSYKAGKLLLFPFRMLKKLFNVK